MEELQERHQRERRDLQDRVAQKKKNATKKTRKGVNDECMQLERHLDERHQIELASISRQQTSDEQGPEAINGHHTGNAPREWDGPPASSSSLIAADKTRDKIEDLQKGIGKTTLSASTDTDHTASLHPKKPNRQKARLARRAAEAEAQAASAAEEAAKQRDFHGEELEAMQREAALRKLRQQDVRSDGHCMYAAVADQLIHLGIRRLQSTPSTTTAAISTTGLLVPSSTSSTSPSEEESTDHLSVRRDAAAFIESHPDDFAPFLEEPLTQFVAKVRDTAEWGGHLELQALARAYALDFCVLQGDGRVEKIDGGGSASEQRTAWLAYYRHYFGLGEHYNSLRKVD